VKLSLNDIDFDVIERTAERRGMPAYQLLRAIADLSDLVVEAPAQKQAVAATAEAPTPPPRLQDAQRLGACFRSRGCCVVRARPPAR
jgi:hypothetical protein